MDSEFAVTDYGSLFINSSFGMPPDISANTTVSIFPTVGPGARVKIKPHDQFEFLAGVYDGDPTDGGKNRHGVRYRLCSHQGFLTIFEGVYHPDFIRWKEDSEPLGGSLKFGSWIHTRDVDDVAATDENGNPHRHQKNFGFYGVLDQMLFREKEGGEQGLGLFVQFGGAPDNRNTVDYYLGAGLSYTGLIPARDRDVLGIAAANAFLSGDLRRARDLEIAAYNPDDPEAGNPPGSSMKTNESALEMTYRIQLHDRVAVQPDYQIVFNPSGEAGAKTAHVLALRFEITY
jgi:porin